MKILQGILLGIAFIMPGVSGGTVALITGIYKELIDSIKNVNWRFLLPIGIGSVISIISLSHVFHYLLNHEIYHSYLYALFFGSVLASIMFCMPKIGKINWKILALILIGASFALIMTSKASDLCSFENESLIWLLLPCGMLLAIAMLIPGISGSYLLHAVGMYSVITGTINNVTSGVSYGPFDVVAWFMLASLLVGFLIGILIFSRVISFFLFNFQSYTMALLIGFMLGSLRSIWPFWSFVLEDSKLKLINQIIPTISFQTAIAILFCLIGTLSIFLIEYIFQKRWKKI